MKKTTLDKHILGLDLGSNSIGWTLLLEENDKITEIIDLGVRIFNKAVEEKIPTPKNKKRRNMRLARRVLQRRTRRKQRMLNYLVSLGLLPKELQGNTQPEIILNKIDNPHNKSTEELGFQPSPYHLRTKGLYEKLSAYEFGRVLLHFVARRGFLSSKKQVAGDLIDDPDTLAYLAEIDNNPTKNKEEGEFKVDILEVYKEIEDSGARTLGEYLFKQEYGKCKRNRQHAGGHLRTDRAMYKDELKQIWQVQAKYFPDLPANFIEEIEQIIFYQRPLKLKKDRVGKCSLESKKLRANIARLEFQKFRYLLDINHLEYFERQTEQWRKLNEEQRQKLINYFEHNPKITVIRLKNELGLDKSDCNRPRIICKSQLETRRGIGNVDCNRPRIICKSQPP